MIQDNCTIPVMKMIKQNASGTPGGILYIVRYLNVIIKSMSIRTFIVITDLMAKIVSIRVPRYCIHPLIIQVIKKYNIYYVSILLSFIIKQKKETLGNLCEKKKSLISERKL